nr:XRE family transcriptional regulator [Butyricicoccus sp. AF86-03b2A]
MDVGERIKNRRKQLGLSAEQIAAELGVSPATVYRYESNEIMNMRIDKLEPIAKALHTSPAYLMGWSEESSTASKDTNLVTIHYAGPVAAHFNATPDDAYEQRTIPAEWIGRRRPEDFFLATVSGDSMYPQFQDGDEILCLRCSDMGVSGRIGIMLLGGDEATVKRIEYKPGEDWIDLIPINPEFKPKHIEGIDLEQCRVVGRVIKVIRTVDQI